METQDSNPKDPSQKFVQRLEQRYSEKGFWSSFFCIYQKDTYLEWTEPSGFLYSCIFAAVLAVIYAYGLDTLIYHDPRNFDGILFISLFFSACTTSLRSISAETEAGALRPMSMSLLDPAGIYLGKVVAHWQGQFIFILLYVPLYCLFLKGILPSLGKELLLYLFCLGISSFSLSACGILLSLVCQRTRLKDGLMPLLVLPAVIPVLIFSLRFLAQGRLVEAFWKIPLQHYLILLAPAALYASIGSLLYFHLSADSIEQ